jgi:hypothetical protein
MTFERMKYPAIAFLPLWFLACGEQAQETDGSGGQGSAESRPQQLRGKCAPGIRIGGFEIAVVAFEDPYSSVDGKVAEEPIPVNVPVEIASSGPCRLLRTNNFHCDPPCSSALCVEGGVCVPYPPNQDVGSVFVEGMVQPIVMEPKGSNQYFDTSLPYPAFEPGAPIKLSALGGDLEGFTLYGDGVTPMQSAGEPWRVEPGQELTIAWVADTERDATVVASVNIDQHGVSPAGIACEGPDTGCFVVSAELIDQLLELGTSGSPTAALKRYTVDSTEINAGCVDLTVVSAISVEAIVASRETCQGPEDCPEGKSCDLDTNTCV